MSQTNSPSPSISRLDLIDWDYEGDSSESAFSALHFHPGRFISQIPAALIGRLSNVGDTVLDPFCGSGTTILEAQRLGRAAVGIDLNPVSVMITRTKTSDHTAQRISRLLHGHLAKLVGKRWQDSSTKETARLNAPPSVQGLKWYHPSTLAELTTIWGYITNTHGVAREMLTFCFSSILMSACNETRHWGYICDNTRPLTVKRVDAFALFDAAIGRLIDAYSRRDRQLANISPITSRVFCGDAGAQLKQIEGDSIDLIVTSPPYFGVVDYVKAQRLTMEWLGQDIIATRALETGARSKRLRLSALREYLDEMQIVFAEAARVMRRGAHCCIVIGQSTKRQEALQAIEAGISATGLQLALKTERAIPVGRRQTPSLKEEVLLIYRKP